MRFAGSAWKHDVSQEDIEHAVANPIFEGPPAGEEPPYRVFLIGPDTASNLLEIVLVELDDGEDLAIHAMKLRDKYLPLIEGLSCD